MADPHDLEHGTTPPLTSHEEIAPDKTTFQWAPGPGVEHGHEGTDANLRSAIQWFGSTAVFMFLSIVVLWWVYDVWSGYQTSHESLPSPLFATQQFPPEPRVLPNPVDSNAHPTDPMFGPSDLLIEHRQIEDAELKQYGLEDPTGSPQLPPDAVATVLAANRAATTPKGSPNAGASGVGLASSVSAVGIVEPMPSSSSGGTALENNLQ
jgi:hypothetical protein